MKKPSWTEAEEQYLADNHTLMSNIEIGKELNRSAAAVSAKKIREGLTESKIRAEYAVYKGDDELCMGTAKDCAERLGLTEFTIRFYASKTYRKKISNYKNPDKAVIAFRVD